MKMAKRTIFALIAIIILSQITVYAFDSSIPENKFRLFVDGQVVDIPASLGKPFATDGRTFLPIRATANALGVPVEWVQAEKAVIFNNTIKLKLGSDMIETPNGSFQMDVKVFAIDGRVYVPIRFVSEVLGYKVTWDMKGGYSNIYITRNAVENNDNNVADNETTNETNKKSDLLVYNDRARLTENKSLVEFMKQYDAENYRIEGGSMTFDPYGAVGGNAAVQVFNQLKLEKYNGSNWYEVKILQWDEDSQNVVNQVLKLIAGEEEGQYIFSEFHKGMTTKNAIATETWHTINDIKFKYTNPPGIGVAILVAPLE